MIKKELLLGDEAIAWGALNAGLSGVYAYPGTPSTEITEFIQMHPLTRERGIHCNWSANEKTALEAALGMSFVGKRALVCMKHVGMNVCADAFVNSAMTGANGGLVVVAADDPSMHSSQNEQDSRFYAKFAMIPCFEPASQQEAYEMIGEAFDFSEKYQIPVLMRVTTRMAHSRAVVEIGEPRQQNTLHYPERPRQWILMPGNSRVRYKTLIEENKLFEQEAEHSRHNRYIDGPDKSMGIIACGLAYNYIMENFPEGCPFPVLKISQYPLPTALVQRMASECRSLLIVEEGQPLVEEMIRGLLGTPIPVKGRLSGELPRTGELTPDNVRGALGLPRRESEAASQLTMPRPPALCQGCGHRDVYTALNDVLREHYPDHKVFSDIGCYTLGSLPPFRAIDTCVEMGASVTMAKGAADGGQFPSVAVIGDSTFTHSGMTALLDAVNEKSNITVVISDNLTTGMTGGQDSAGTGRLEQICAGLGVEPNTSASWYPCPRTWRRSAARSAKRSNTKGFRSSSRAASASRPPNATTQKNSSTTMKRDIILSGVGGQGILSIATVIGAAALKEGLHIKQAEVHGMSQRGGDVQSNLRISSDEILSDLIPQGAADIIISLEPMEALRYVPYLNPEGWVIANTTPFVNIDNYPEPEAVLAELGKRKHAILIDVDAIAKEQSSPRAANIVLLGAAAPFLGLDADKFEAGIRSIFARKGEQIVEMNLKAFRAGYEYAQKHRK